MSQPQPPEAIWPKTGDLPRGGSAAPRFVRAVGDMRIVEYLGRYFAVPEYLGAIEQLDLTGTLPGGVRVANSEAALEAEIDYVNRWANSRGHMDAQEARQSGDSPMRAASALGEAEMSVLESGYVMMRGGSGEVYAVRAQDLAQLGRSGRSASTEGVTIASAVSEGAMNQVLGVVNDHMLLFFDHMFYAIPTLVLQAAARDPRLAGMPLHLQPGVIMDASYPEVLRRIGWRRERRLRSATGPASAEAAGTDAAPRLVRALRGYRIIAYEGWFYGVPESLGPVDLTQTDALSLPGVIADVAQTAVETVIVERVTGAAAGA